jgi:hypothetical protein
MPKVWREPKETVAQALSGLETRLRHIFLKH